MNLVEDEASRVVENHNQEIPNLLDRLAEMGIGRPLYVVQKTSALSEQDQAKTGIQTPTETTYVKVGHALLANKEGTAHIIIASDGSMMFIEASRTSQAQIDRYRGLFDEVGVEPLSQSLLPLPDTAQTILDTIKISSLQGSVPIATFLDGRMPEYYPQVKEKFDQALSFAKDRKEAIEETKLQMKKDVTAGLRELLEPPPPPPPPAAPPPAA